MVMAKNSILKPATTFRTQSSRYVVDLRATPPNYQGLPPLTNGQSNPRFSANEEDVSNLKPTIIEDDVASELKALQEASINGVESRESALIVQRPADPATSIKYADDDSATTRKSHQLRRDTEGNLRSVSGDGQELYRHIDDCSQEPSKDFKEFRLRKMMEDLSPKSSLSPTQANSESAYRHYFQGMLLNRLSLTQDRDVDKDGNDNHTQKVAEPAKQQHSLVTDSTAYTYAEDDTGHVNLFLTAPENHGKDENISQDGSFAPPPHRFSQPPFEPRTPAAMNPFSQKGSVMKGHEMFGVTQPSSIGKHIASPTSSRPSPDFYGKSSPQKRMTTSPLERHGSDASALQSSVRTMLRSKSTTFVQRSDSPLPASSRSCDSKRVRREPRDIYVSTKESQERRRKASSGSDSETESDSEKAAIKRQWVREIDTRIQMQLARVISSRPGSGTTGEVEVPASGGRRSSLDEDYIAQCNGTDAPETQQDDVIIDSQTIVGEPEVIDLPDQVNASQGGASHAALRADCIEPLLSSPQLPARRQPVGTQCEQELNLTSQSEGNPSHPKDPASPLRQLSLPLQEVSMNRNDLKTPVGGKAVLVFSDGADTTIPNTILETSPLMEDQIRPIGEVTSLSFGDTAYDDTVVNNAPGFTPDVEFNHFINARLSSTPSPGSRTRGFHPFEQTAALAANAPSIARILTDGGLAGNEHLSNAAKIVSSEKPYAHDTMSNRETILNEPTPHAETFQDKERKRSALRDVQENELVDKEASYAVEAPHNADLPSQSQKRLEMSSKAVLKPGKEPVAKRDGLRTRAELKGPSKALRSSDEITTPTSLHSSFQGTKLTSAAKTSSTRSSKVASDASSRLSSPITSVDSTPAPGTRFSTRQKRVAFLQVGGATPSPASKTRKPTTEDWRSTQKSPAPLPQRSLKRSKLLASGAQTAASILSRSSKRTSTFVVDEEPLIIKTSKRQSASFSKRESSDGPLANPDAFLGSQPRLKKANKLFSRMAFAISYLKHDNEKSRITDLIAEQNGWILKDGFENLFESSSTSRSQRRTGDEGAELNLAPTAKTVGFIALIADEHSRKAKYMQALALGLPCISGRWIIACVARGEVIDWCPYLLCAGQSTFLGNAIRSRTLGRYSATDTKFCEIFKCRDKLLNGKSILLITPKGKEDSRKAYVFLTRALGPARIAQVSDYEQARKKLLDDDSWDLLYVDRSEGLAEAAVFGSSVASGSGSKKRKRGPTAVVDGVAPAPKKLRIISDEVIIQSLILGQLVED